MPYASQNFTEGQCHLLNLYTVVFWIATVTGLELFLDQNLKESRMPVFKVLRLLALPRSRYRSHLENEVEFKRHGIGGVCSGCTGVLEYSVRACLCYLYLQSCVPLFPEERCSINQLLCEPREHTTCPLYLANLFYLFQCTSHQLKFLHFRFCLVLLEFKLCYNKHLVFLIHGVSPGVGP